MYVLIIRGLIPNSAPRPAVCGLGGDDGNNQLTGRNNMLVRLGDAPAPVKSGCLSSARSRMTAAARLLFCRIWYCVLYKRATSGSAVCGFFGSGTSGA